MERLIDSIGVAYATYEKYCKEMDKKNKKAKTILQLIFAN